MLFFDNNSVSQYFGIVLVVTGGEIAFIVITYTRPDWIESSLSSGWDSATNVSRSNIQTELTCCGFYNSSDRADLPCPANATSGCYDQIQDKVAQYDTYVKAAGYTLIALEVIIMCLTLTLACTTRTEEERKEELDEARRMTRDANGGGGKDSDLY